MASWYWYWVLVLVLYLLGLIFSIYWNGFISFPFDFVYAKLETFERKRERWNQTEGVSLNQYVNNSRNNSRQPAQEKTHPECVCPKKMQPIQSKPMEYGI